MLKPFTYEVGAVGSGLTITVPAGFVTDFASVPSRKTIATGLLVVCILCFGSIYEFNGTPFAALCAATLYLCFASLVITAHIKIKPHGRYSQAAALHDYLYLKGLVSRWICDRILFEAMDSLQVNYPTRLLMYYAVRLGGWQFYDRKNLAEVQLQCNKESDNTLEVVPHVENTYTLKEADEGDLGF